MKDLIPSQNGVATQEEVGTPVTASEIIAEASEVSEVSSESPVASEAQEPEVEIPTEVATQEENQVKELSLAEQFLAQAGQAVPSADPELEITDTHEPISIRDEILAHLKFQDQTLWTNLSPLLRMIANRESVDAIRRAITALAEEKKIRLHHNAHDMWGSPSGSDSDQKTTYHSIDNLNVYVKLY